LNGARGLPVKVRLKGFAPKETEMSIEQFIDNDVKSNDVVLFHEGGRRNSSAVRGFLAKWSRSSTTVGVG